MPTTVLENAYFKKASLHPNYSSLHQKIMFVLVHEKKYYSKEELLCFANYNEKLLDDAIKDLAEAGAIKSEGWLVSLKENIFEEEILKDFTLV
jgi:predicted HTH transcriptional regulator